MKILFVSRMKNGSVNPFIFEQGESLKKYKGYDVHYYLLERGGVMGYLISSLKIWRLNKNQKFDIIHAHNGLSGLAVAFSKMLSFFKMKLVITFHGTDINDSKERKLSILASKISDANILVSSQMLRYFSENSEVIPCGIDMDIDFQNANDIRRELDWGEKEFVILFSSAFNRKVKDPDFALEVIAKLKKETKTPIKFLELNGLNRKQVNQFMQAADVLLMCSISEGSPQVIKEAILNRLPIVSNDVGEVKSICKGVDACFIIPKNVNTYIKTLKSLVQKPLRIKNNENVILNFDNKSISKKISKVYRNIYDFNEHQKVH
jgi:glycosyltransferase involved in cell wall biosynthesis